MRKQPVFIAALLTLFAAYPAYLVTREGERLLAADATLNLVALLAATALISFVSALLARSGEQARRGKPRGGKVRQSGSGRERKQTRSRDRQGDRRSERVETQGTAAPSALGPRETGSVKWFNSTKGFGFITRDSGDDIFVHFRSIRGEGHRTLRDGERVDYVVSDAEKGLQADDVVAID